MIGEMPHPPCRNILARVTADDGRVYYRSLCRVCAAWIGGEKDLTKMPASALARAYETTERKIEDAREKYKHVVYSKPWYEKKGVKTV
ncbi:MAG: hypothetical protein GY765_33605 [bacterium]|nr:hypothetical protein [bacterium]